MPTQAENIAIFEDTQRICSDVPATEFIKEDFQIKPMPGNCPVRVIDADTLTACREGDVALNFASGWIPGGGVLRGCTAQEENLCRRSSLYRSLVSNEAKGFYLDNHSAPNIGTNAMLISRGVKVLKDANYRRLDRPFEIDVLTVAAPRLCDGLPCSPSQLAKAQRSRVFAIVKTLVAKGYRRAILGAWGCGAYRNDPETISGLFAEALQQYAGYFDEVIFAIPIGRDSRNFTTFQKALVRHKDTPKFVFFWRVDDAFELACYSQWFISPFIVDDTLYMCTEQYMMHQKALLFGDHDTAQAIMDTDDPRKMKKLGRAVKNFDSKVWDAHKFDIVVRGNMAKFTQDQVLQDILIATGDKIIVEASPLDDIWGIGMAKDDPNATNPSCWRGQNLLGKALMQVRSMLQK